MPAPRGMASQQRRTFERGVYQNISSFNFNKGERSSSQNNNYLLQLKNYLRYKHLLDQKSNGPNIVFDHDILKSNI